jgi:CubicO group peptidase (beta-lactamase class C family)
MQSTAGEIGKHNWFLPQHLSWALRNGQALADHVAVFRGTGPALSLPAADSRFDLSALRFRPDALGPEIRIVDYLQSIRIDGIMVLQDGRVRAEAYFDGFSAHQPHQWASLSKSVGGMLANVLAAEGAVDLARPAGHYVPELAGTPFADATLQQCLDMEVSADWPAVFNEMDWLAAAGLVPSPAGATPGIRHYIRTVPKRNGSPHGSTYHYNNPAAEVVAWALENATSQRWPELLSRHLWSKIGVEHDAAVIVDGECVALASGGLIGTLPDLARFAEVVRRAEGDTALSQAARACLASARNAARFAAGNITPGRAGYGYRNLWYHTPAGEVVADGRFGQRVVIDIARSSIVAMLASNPAKTETVAEGVKAMIAALAAA